MRIQPRAHLVKRGREHWEARVEGLSHPGPLAPLACEQEPHPAVRCRDAVDHVRGCLASARRGEARQELLPVARQHHRSMLQAGPRGGQRVSHVGGAQARVLGEVIPQPLRLRPQSLRAARRHQPWHRLRQPCRRTGLPPGPRCASIPIS